MRENEQSSNLQVKQTATGTLYAFYILDDIEADAKVWDWWEGCYQTIESCTSQRYFVEKLAAAKAGDTVELHINSYGGSAKEAVGIYNHLRRCPAKVVAFIDGFACSAASVVAMAAETVFMPRSAAMMLHNAAWAVYGNADELRKSADDLEVINTAAMCCYLQHAAGRLDEVTLREICDAETWLTAEQCIGYGLADQYAEADIDIDTAAQAFAASMQITALAGARTMAPPPGVCAALNRRRAAGDPQAGAGTPQEPPQEPQEPREDAGNPDAGAPQKAPQGGAEPPQPQADAAPNDDPPAEPAPGPAEKEPAHSCIYMLLRGMTETNTKNQ